jgi:hypothetical protein
VTALITGVHIRDQLLAATCRNLGKGDEQHQHYGTLQEGIVHVFIFIAERGIAKEHRDFYIVILIP